MNSDRLSVIFLNLFIISFPLSVTASQSFAILSAFFFLYSSYSNKSLLVTLRNRAFIASIALYLSLFFSLIWNIRNYETSIFSIFFKSEISDFWMCFSVLPAFYHVRNPEYRRSILRSFYISAFLVVLTGLITIFTPFRLASYITAGFQVKEGTRLQHFAGDFWGRYTFLPIGLMNTHLTFGGLCGLLFPGLVCFIGFTFKERNNWKNASLVLFSILFLIVLFYNQSRSIWLGVCFTFGLIFLKLIDTWRLENLKFRWKYFFISAFVISLIFVSSYGIYNRNWLLQRAFQEGLEDNTTENQRYFIYKNTLSLIGKHWLVGVGPGRFEISHRDESNKMILNNEQLWYELYITPRQHAHHDLLHFYAIGGILGLVAFLHFWFYLFRLFITNPLTSQTVLFSGIIGIFIAGFFQCYLLDDEVALPFFTMIGMFAGSLQKEDARARAIAGIRARKVINPNDSFQVESISIESSFIYLKTQFSLSGKNSPFEKFNFYTITLLLIPIFFSLIFIFYKTRLSPDKVYKRKVTLNYPEDKHLILKSLRGELVLFSTIHMSGSDFIRIEGCLSHNFSNPISIRKDPYDIVLRLPANAKNPPNTVFVKIRERDSFDQDKLYKVHQSRLTSKEISFPISTSGKTKISIDQGEISKNLLPSRAFPENIFFRDFEFRFSGFDSSQTHFDLPTFDFGKLCDAK